MFGAKIIGGRFILWFYLKCVYLGDALMIVIVVTISFKTLLSVWAKAHNSSRILGSLNNRDNKFFNK